MGEQLMTMNQVAERLLVTVGTLRQWRFHGKGPKSFRVGGAVRYRQADVEQWLEDQVRQEPVPA